MQKGGEECRYVGQCVTPTTMQQSTERIRRRKTYKSSERNNTFYPVVSVKDRYSLLQIDNVCLSLLSVLNEHTNIDLSNIMNLNDQQELIDFLNKKMLELFQDELTYFDFEDVVFNGKSIILYKTEATEGNCFTLDCINSVDDENLKKIIRYTIGALIVKYKFPTFKDNYMFNCVLEYSTNYEEEEDVEPDIEESFNEYFNKHSSVLDECISEYIKGSNDWHYDYLMEIPNHTKIVKTILEMVKHYQSYESKDFCFSKIIHEDLSKTDDEYMSFDIYFSILPSYDAVFENYEEHINAYCGDYSLEEMVYTKDYSLEGVENTIKHEKTVKYIKKIVEFLWKI